MSETPPLYPADVKQNQWELDRPVADVFSVQTFDAALAQHGEPPTFPADPMKEEQPVLDIGRTRRDTLRLSVRRLLGLESPVAAICNAQTFDAAARSHQPTPFSVTDVYKALTDQSAGLGYLSEAEVSDISCYLGSPDHFLLLCVRVPPPSGTGSSTTLWARAERSPSVQLKSVQDSSKAYDTIKFSYDEALCRGSRGDDFSMQIQCCGVKVVHVAHLFSLMHQYSPNYHLLGNWWFPVVGIGALRHLKAENNWSKCPSIQWIQLVGISKPAGAGRPNAPANVVTRKFFEHWNVRKHVDFTKPETWGVSLAQVEESPIFPAEPVKGRKPESREELDNPGVQHPSEIPDNSGGGLNLSNTNMSLLSHLGDPWAFWILAFRRNPDVRDVEDLTNRLEHTHRKGKGRGGYSDVYLSHLRDNTKSTLIQVCYKVLVPTSNMDISDVAKKVTRYGWREMRAWKDLRHPNIVKFLGFAIERTSHQTTVALVSEWCSHGNVVEYLAQNPWVGRKEIAVDVARGLLYLHSRNPIIIHADVKPANVLINDMGHALLCDFGLSRILDKKPSGYTGSEHTGTLRYLAPELVENWVPTEKSDVFAFACTCIRIFFDQDPYHSCKNDLRVVNLISQNVAPREWGDNPLERILASCCQPLSPDRPRMSKVVAELEFHLLGMQSETTSRVATWGATQWRQFVAYIPLFLASLFFVSLCFGLRRSDYLRDHLRYDI